MRFDRFIDLLKELVRQPAVVGSEHSFLRVLQRALEERGARVTWYEGLLVAEGERPGAGKISAHVDRHGLVCTGPNEFQYAAFVAGNRSDLLGNSVSEQMMRKVAGRFESVQVLAYEPWSGAYLGAGEITKSYICEKRNNLMFEIRGLEHLLAGTPVAFADRLKIADGRLSAQLDNVLTTAALVHLFDLGYCGTAFFTEQEESGRSWRYLLEWFRRFGGTADDLLVLDTSPYPDHEAADEQHVVLRKRDANAAFNPETTRRVEAECVALGIPYSFKDDYIERKNAEATAQGIPQQSLGSTEMGRIIAASKNFVNGTTVQIPTTGYHTTNESVSVQACEAFLKLLLRLADCRSSNARTP